MSMEVRKRKDSQLQTKTNKADSKDRSSDEIKPKFGPLPQFRTQRVWARGVMVLGVFAVVYFSSKSNKEIALAKYKDVHEYLAQEVSCSASYKDEVIKFPGCLPKRCGRLVSDKIISASEATALLDMAKRLLAMGKPLGGAAILDLHSGAISYEQGFVNMYKMNEAASVFRDSDFELYRTVQTKIQLAVANYFQVERDILYLTHPTFFSRLTSSPPLTIHDEYWHTHVDKETYEAFHFTSLLYLSDYGRDFQGGRFVFVDADKVNRTVEPRTGRVSMFTSGSENTHFVERVSAGTRYAITVSFTCDQKHAISHPVIHDKRNT
ncbi:hypothetical protein R5R35_008979 [Gryllus longicercus]|uniref:Fe2OG dioxygenase domain-containing protein n=1 Tax=Gryllus longicercus TaxID=2509291 RepID=A0AAN9Z378_9ORTH|nr:PKHD domain-containing transmembrane protein [Gryllus bimaculatus]